MAKEEVFISFDIEADGPCPGVNSMLSLGCAAYKRDGTLVGTFSANLDTLEGAKQHPSTMAWWRKQPEAWEACRKDLEQPESAMERFAEWLIEIKRTNKATLVACAYPAGFDWPFLYYYCHRFLGCSPLGFACLDMKTFAMALLGTDYRRTSKRRMPQYWFDESLPHDHVAVHDAVEQGYTFVQMLSDFDALHKTAQPPRVQEPTEVTASFDTFGKTDD